MLNEFIQTCITEVKPALPKRNLTYPKKKEMGSQVTPKAHFTIMKLKRYF